MVYMPLSHRHVVVCVFFSSRHFYAVFFSLIVCWLLHLFSVFLTLSTDYKLVQQKIAGYIDVYCLHGPFISYVYTTCICITNAYVHDLKISSRFFFNYINRMKTNSLDRFQSINSRRLLHVPHQYTHTHSHSIEDYKVKKEKICFFFLSSLLFKNVRIEPKNDALLFTVGSQTISFHTSECRVHRN